MTRTITLGAGDLWPLDLPDDGPRCPECDHPLEGDECPGCGWVDEFEPNYEAIIADRASRRL